MNGSRSNAVLGWAATILVILECGVMLALLQREEFAATVLILPDQIRTVLSWLLPVIAASVLVAAAFGTIRPMRRCY